MQNLHIIRFVDFPLRERSLYMPCNNGLITLKQLAHLFLRQPNRLVLETYIQSHRIIGLINDYFILWFAHRHDSFVLAVIAAYILKRCATISGSGVSGLRP